MRLYAFEKLEVWQLSRQLVRDVYGLTSKFPADEKFGLTNQMRRAAISISSNIVEGNSRRSRKDKIRFIEIAYGSLLEALSQLIIAVDLGFITDESYVELRPKFEELSNKLNALRKAYNISQ